MESNSKLSQRTKKIVLTVASSGVALMANRKCFEALDRTLRDIEKVKKP